MKKLIAGGIAGVVLLANTLPVFAHGANPNKLEYYVNPESRACMGQLARMHAQDEKHDTNGIPASMAVSRHPKFHEYGTGATVQQSMQAFQEYCGLHLEE